MNKKALSPVVRKSLCPPSLAPAIMVNPFTPVTTNSNAGANQLSRVSGFLDHVYLVRLLGPSHMSPRNLNAPTVLLEGDPFSQNPLLSTQNSFIVNSTCSRSAQSTNRKRFQSRLHEAAGEVLKPGYRVVVREVHHALCVSCGAIADSPRIAMGELSAHWCGRNGGGPLASVTHHA